MKALKKMILNDEQEVDVLKNEEMRQVLGGFGWDPRCTVDCKQSGISPLPPPVSITDCRGNCYVSSNEVRCFEAEVRVAICGDRS